MAATIKIIDDIIDDVLPTEEWRCTPGYDRYEVSSHGRIRNKKTGRILRGTLTRDGYVHVDLSTEKYMKHSVKVHRIVASAFLVNPSEKPCIDHKDGNRQNNNVYNLRWATRAENNRNSKKRNDNTSGFRGVSWSKTAKKWKVQCNDRDGRHTYLGLYKDPFAAALSYNVFALKEHGEFAKLNVIPPQCKQQPPTDTDISDTSSIASSSSTTNLSD